MYETSVLTRLVVKVLVSFIKTYRGLKREREGDTGLLRWMKPRGTESQGQRSKIP